MNEEELSQVIVGESPLIRHVREQVLRFAAYPLPVLIQGPTGSGKERVAEAIHKASGRSGKHVAINVCAIPEQLFETALFGQVRGAFTGAVVDTKGHFGEANGGTIFLDEIADLSKPVQAKLLRVLESGDYRPVGAERDRSSDFRVVAATHEDLPERVAHGLFRDDLYFRLSGVTIFVPSLDERREDIPAIVRYFASNSKKIPRGTVFTEGALAWLQDRSWPGNVRELRFTVERAAICALEGVVDSPLLQDFAGQRSNAGGESALGRGEREVLLSALGRNDWRIEQTAAELGVHRTTVFRRMRELKISQPRPMPLEDKVKLSAK
jgi:DNA-binding NtrC family response regulator